ncbi:MAG: hypothetical protein GTN67_05910 [Hydrotalea flava]|uniref:hypothetical protein n=1 Tax=Hydrotalea TaxID=1004300 RepID=UPI0009454167|nr:MULTISPECIES: hypothetical protein [Hydrotalea]NIM34970.1 hypothetical protein [Hydrotalea flava]NIM37796.1 hypothetical protein [Hydrotalea flava]NIN02965.1 hypothetical protein [Hydrotalea flava]NIN14650.1 hypothetical protein [Hydrotalea flava]NIO93722.1 hypothetical protein [Hydrotalea flava]
MKQIKFLFILFLLFLSFSCTKQTIVQQTSADEITIELQKVIKNNNINRIIAWTDNGGFPTNISPTSGTTWSFSNGFISIQDQLQTFNLLYLDYYNVAKVMVNDGTNPVALILHFKN